MMFVKSSLVVVAGVALALPLAAAFAQSADDVAYCQALSSLVRTVNRGHDPTGAGPQAMATCTTTPGSSIPTLENILTNAKVSLPARPGMAASSFNPKAYGNMTDCLNAAAAAKAPLNLCGPRQGM